MELDVYYKLIVYNSALKKIMNINLRNSDLISLFVFERNFICFRLMTKSLNNQVHNAKLENSNAAPSVNKQWKTVFEDIMLPSSAQSSSVPSQIEMRLALLSLYSHPTHPPTPPGQVYLSHF